MTVCHCPYYHALTLDRVVFASGEVAPFLIPDVVSYNQLKSTIFFYVFYVIFSREKRSWLKYRDLDPVVRISVFQVLTPK